MGNNKKNEENKKLYIGWISIGVAIVVLGMWFATYFLLRGRGTEIRGTFGDMFGSVNAVYSGLAFAGIIITIYLQSHELKLQREELKETRQEFITQNETLRIQRFENTFFQMISLFNSITNNTIIKNSGNVYEGRSAYTRISDLIHHKARNKALVSGNTNDSLADQINNYSTDEILKFYDDEYHTYKAHLAHYYRTFYHIIKLIHNTSDIDKRQYISIARAQLSSHEIILFLYNGLHKNGSEKFKPLIEEYTLFNNIDEDLLINLKPLSQYKKTAFKYIEELK
ncbi:putative phage abortive infection protein [Chryseobacterium sp. JM1]|uniref:putative phage abortive infection protein n=1 Tax=Chryseobacterium sp. JM1 TaxID=1233950 RepID=UPI0004E75236|nr:putative phage abortive infection protein [Chryseobacterium sp. JM1]KFF17784.1 hypothetical protein IW22_19390 [Chryseobacterium sp. JM1]